MHISMYCYIPTYTMHVRNNTCNRWYIHVTSMEFTFCPGDRKQGTKYIYTYIYVYSGGIYIYTTTRQGNPSTDHAYIHVQCSGGVHGSALACEAVEHASHARNQGSNPV